MCGQGVAGASALVTIGDAFEEDLADVPQTTGSDAQCTGTAWRGAAGNPSLQIAVSGNSLVLSWSDLWNGLNVQAQQNLGSQSAGRMGCDTAIGQWPVALRVTVPAGGGMFYRLSNQ